MTTDGRVMGRLARIAYIKPLNSALVPGCLQILTNRIRIDSPILYSTVAPSIQNPISTSPFRGILRCQFFKVQPFPVFAVSVHTPRSFRQLWRALRPELIAFSIDGFQRFRSIPSDPALQYHRSHTTMEANGIYLILSVAAVEYHWGIYVAENATKGVIHHANNAQGGWSYERKLTQTLVLSKMLALALKIGTIPLPQGHTQIDPILGNPNMISQDPGFRCRAWALDGVARLHTMGVVNTPDNSAVMAKAYQLANANRSNIELGTGSFVVATL